MNVLHVAHIMCRQVNNSYLNNIFIFITEYLLTQTKIEMFRNLILYILNKFNESRSTVIKFRWLKCI